jgi:type IV pilus assembly protein PilN
MRVTVNLATRPYIDIGPAIKRLRIAMGVLFLIAIGLALGVRAFHQQAVEARATEESVQKRIDAINLERMGYQNRMRQPENALLLAQVGTLNQLFDEKTFSWTLGMEDLETVLPGGVQVTSLEPVRNKDGSITLRLRVVGPRDRSVELVENLEHSRHFLLPRIVGESSDSTNGPNERMAPPSASNRVNFELLADYNSAAPVESKAEKKAEEKKAEEQQPKGRGALSSPKLKPPPVPPGYRPNPPAPSQPPQLRPAGNQSPIPKPNPGGPR